VSKVNVIAIDGPAGSGKSTVAKGVARRLKALYIDTGAMYRALTLKAIKEAIDFNNEEALSRLAAAVDIQLKMRGDFLQVMLDGEDVSKAIRKQALTEKVRFVAGIAGVRKEMVKLQRRLARASKSGAVLEGRDIGTVVFPDAEYKFYLDAHPEERAKRRHKELKQMGQKVSLKSLARDIKIRDRGDMTRNVAPLVKAQDATYIDTTDLSVKEVVEEIGKKCSI